MSFGLGLEFGLGLGLPGGRCRNRLFRLCSSRALAPVSSSLEASGENQTHFFQTEKQIKYNKFTG